MIKEFGLHVGFRWRKFHIAVVTSTYLSINPPNHHIIPETPYNILPTYLPKPIIILPTEAVRTRPHSQLTRRST